MSRSPFSIFRAFVWVLLLGTVLPAAVWSQDKGQPSPEETALRDLLVVLKKEGGFAHAEFPLTVYVERVEGHTLRNVRFVRRVEGGKRCDLVGTAQTAELLFDQTRRQVLIHAKHLNLLREESATESYEAYLEDKVLPVELPPNWRRLLSEPGKLPARKNLPLSPHAKKFLERIGTAEPPRSESDEIIGKAFGENSVEATMPIRMHFAAKNLVLCANQFDIEPSGRLKLTPFSLVRVDEDGKPLATMRCTHAHVVTEGDPIAGLADLSTRRISAIECTGGVRITLDNK